MSEFIIRNVALAYLKEKEKAMDSYKILPTKCSECLWLNCCTWFYDRDPFRCRNQTTKDRYVKEEKK